MLRSIACATVLCLALSACETMPWQKKPRTNPPVELLSDSEMRELGAPGQPLDAPVQGLAPAPARRFQEVPLPAGLKEDPEQSYVYESQTVQIGRMVYYSRASVNELAQFYISTCKAEGWKLESVLTAESSASLDFSKDSKRLKVLVEARGFGRSRKLTLNLTPDAPR